MEIGKMLLRFRIRQLRENFERLGGQVQAHQQSDDARDLRIFIHTKVEELDMLEMVVDHSEDVSEKTNRKPIDMFRRLKHDYHTAHRRWQALHPIEERRRLDIAA